MRVKVVSILGAFVVAFLAALAAEAQQPAKVPRIGFLGTLPTDPHYEALRQGFHEFGYAEGQNIEI